MKAKLASLRDRASHKKVPFNLDLAWLDNFIQRTGYDHTLHHIDRIITWGGYTKGNLQILSISDNTAKGNRERRGQSHLF